MPLRWLGFATTAIITLTSASTRLAAQDVTHPLRGAWAGGTNVTGRWIFAEVRIAESADGQLHGALDVAGAQAAGIALDSLQLAGDRVTFTTRTPLGGISFAGSVRDGIIDGVLSGGAPNAGLHLFRLADVSDAFSDSVSGAYDAGDGRQLYLTPHPRGVLSAFLIGRDGVKETVVRTLFLLPTAHDRYVSSGSVVSVIRRDETFALERSANGDIAAIRWHVPNGPDRVLTRLPFAAQKSVSYAGPAGRISGTLYLPRTAGPHPAVVLVGGSGPTSRDNLFLRAREFLRLGLAVLSLDKRGVGATDGDYFRSSLEDYADDATASLTWLRRQPGIDATRVGMHGHSQGGWVAPWAATKAAQPPAWLIITSGGPIAPAEQELWRARSQTLAAGLSEPDAQAAEAFMRLKWQYGFSGRGWAEYQAAAAQASAAKWSSVVSPILTNDPIAWSFMRRLATFDPIVQARALRMPLLVLFGDRDNEQPPAISEARWREVLAASNHKAFEIATIPGAGHSLWFGAESPTPLFSTPTELIGAWLTRITK